MIPHLLLGSFQLLRGLIKFPACGGEDRTIVALDYLLDAIAFLMAASLSFIAACAMRVAWPIVILLPPVFVDCALR